MALGGTKPRAVLAVLLLHANEPVSAERLAVALWGDEAPASATRTVQVHMSRLRRVLGEGRERVVSGPAGYCLRVGPGELDRERFETMVEQGRRALADGRAEEATEVLREAVALWRGPPLSDLAFEPFARNEVAALEEQRLAALELRLEAEVAARREVEVIGELRRLVAEHPLRERLRAQHMLALYRLGLHSEALASFQELRQRLDAELGLEPGAELRELEQEVLTHRADLQRAARRSAVGLPAALDGARGSPLAGRRAELAMLMEAWERAVTGRRQIVVVAGVSGLVGVGLVDPGRGRDRWRCGRAADEAFGRARVGRVEDAGALGVQCARRGRGGRSRGSSGRSRSGGAGGCSSRRSRGSARGRARSSRSAAGTLGRYLSVLNCASE